jgi:hypothetical protein
MDGTTAGGAALGGGLEVTETEPVAVNERTMNMKNHLIPLNSDKKGALLGSYYSPSYPYQLNTDGIFYCLNDQDIPYVNFQSASSGGTVNENTSNPVMFSITKEDATNYFLEYGNAASLKNLSSYREWSASDWKVLVDRVKAQYNKTFRSNNLYYAPCIRVAPNSTYENPVFIVYTNSLYKWDYSLTRTGAGSNNSGSSHTGAAANRFGVYFKVEGFDTSTATITEIIQPVKHSEWDVSTLGPTAPPNYVDGFVGMPIHARAEANDVHRNITADWDDPYWAYAGPQFCVNSNVIAITHSWVGTSFYNLADCSYIKSWSHPVLSVNYLNWGLNEFDTGGPTVVASDDYIVLLTGETNARASKSIDNYSGAGSQSIAEDAAFFEDYLPKAALGEIHVFDGTGQNYLYSLFNPGFQDPGAITSGHYRWNGFGFESGISISGKYLEVNSQAPLVLTQEMKDAMVAAGNNYSESYSEPTVGELLSDEGAIHVYDLSIVPSEQYGSYGTNETLLYNLRPDTDYANKISGSWDWNYPSNPIAPYGDNDAIILVSTYRITKSSYGIKGFLASTGEELFHLPNTQLNGDPGLTWIGDVHGVPNSTSSYTSYYHLQYLPSGVIIGTKHTHNTSPSATSFDAGFSGFGARFAVEGEKRIQIGENQFLTLPLNSSTSIAKNRTGSAELVKAIAALEIRIAALENV